MASRLALLGALALSHSAVDVVDGFGLARIAQRRVSQSRATRRGVRVRCVDLPPEDEGVEGLLSPTDLAALRARMEDLRRGDTDAPTELYKLMTRDEPPKMIVDFLRSSSPLVIEAMQGAVMSLVGSLPPQFNMQFKSSLDRVAALSFQLQMTGYMFRNAEYRLSLRQVLKLKADTISELRKAFDRLDSDGSGYIDASEARLLLERIKGGAVRVNGTLVFGGVSNADVREFLDVFDGNKDARVSWEEFKAVLGGALRDDTKPRLAPGAEEVAPAPAPDISGTVKLRMDNGEEIEVDAAKYVAELKDRVTAMRSELGRIEAGKSRSLASSRTSMGAYLESLDPAELKQLTASVSPDVVDAMKMLVQSVTEGLGESPSDEVLISRQMLGQLCMWQLVLGYRLREAEAQGKIQERKGL